MTTAFIGRQPIYNRRQEVIAYELSARTNNDGESGPTVTADMLSRHFGATALTALIGEQLAYIHFNPDVILEKEPFPTTPQQIVIELDAATPINTMLEEGLKDLKERGYKIALEINGPEIDVSAPLPLADIVRIDSQAFTQDQLKEAASEFGGFHGQVLVAGLNTWEMYSVCHDLGFDYFHGFFFSQAEPVRGRKLPASRMTTMRLLAQLNSPDVELEELEKVISQDVSLSYRLLRHLNSAFFGLGHKIDSIRHAVALLGLRNLKVWSSIILLAKIDDKPMELMKTALIRAKMCEQLAVRTKMAVEDTAFMTGLLSTLEALLDMPIDTILAELPLTGDITSALTQNQGALGVLLTCTLSYEQTDWDKVIASGIDPAMISKAYFVAIQWAEETLAEINQGE